MHRVILQQVRQVVGRHEVVDADDLDVRIFGGDAVDKTADAAEAVDADTDGHGWSLSRKEVRVRGSESLGVVWKALAISG